MLDWILLKIKIKKYYVATYDVRMLTEATWHFLLLYLYTHCLNFIWCMFTSSGILANLYVGLMCVWWYGWSNSSYLSVGSTGTQSVIVVSTSLIVLCFISQDSRVWWVSLPQFDKLYSHVCALIILSLLLLLSTRTLIGLQVSMCLSSYFYNNKHSEYTTVHSGVAAETVEWDLWVLIAE